MFFYYKNIDNLSLYVKWLLYCWWTKQGVKTTFILFFEFKVFLSKKNKALLKRKLAHLKTSFFSKIYKKNQIGARPIWLVKSLLCGINILQTAIARLIFVQIEDCLRYILP